MSGAQLTNFGANYFTNIRFGDEMLADIVGGRAGLYAGDPVRFAIDALHNGPERLTDQLPVLSTTPAKAGAAEPAKAAEPDETVTQPQFISDDNPFAWTPFAPLWDLFNGDVENIVAAVALGVVGVLLLAAGLWAIVGTKTVVNVAKAAA